MIYNKYDKVKNNTMIACYFVLTIFFNLYTYLNYYYDYLNFNQLMMCVVLSFIPLFITALFNLLTKGKSKYTKYFAITGYLLSYAIAIFLIRLDYMFIFAILMIFLIIIYHNRLLQLIFNFALFIVNFTALYIYGISNFSSTYVLMTFIELSAIVLTAIITDLICQSIKYNDNLTNELSDYILRDRLTGAFNRNFIIDNLIFDKKCKNGISLAFIDIDDFKYINDSYGHDYGDMVLQQFGNIILQKLSSEKEVYLVRIGGDEFLIIAIDMPYQEFVKLILSVKEKIIKTTFSKNKINTYIRISVGVTSTNECTSGDFDELYKHADDRLYQAKRQGKNQVVY